MNIFIDQGHNPQNPNAGAEYGGVREQDVNYTVGVLLADILRTVPGIEVRLSRNTPYEQLGTSNATSLAARVNAANAWPADYFISLHCNISVNYPQAQRQRGLYVLHDRSRTRSRRLYTRWAE